MGVAEQRNMYLRQLDILKPEVCNMPITLIGAGATGSFTALALAKMGIHDITVYDADTVEEHNFPNQLFPINALGINKAIALYELVHMYTGYKIKPVPHMFTEKNEVSGIVICALDSMKGRRMIYKMCAGNPKVNLLIDPRCGAEVCRVLTMTPELKSSCEKYKATLHSDDKADPTPCTARSIIYSVLTVSSLICNQVKRYLMNQELRTDMLMDLSTHFSYFDK